MGPGQLLVGVEHVVAAGVRLGIDQRRLLVDALAHGHADRADQVHLLAELRAVGECPDLDLAALEKADRYAVATQAGGQLGDGQCGGGLEARFLQNHRGELQCRSHAPALGRFGIPPQDQVLQPGHAPLQLSSRGLQSSLRSRSQLEGGDSVELLAQRYGVGHAVGRLRLSFFAPLRVKHDAAPLAERPFDGGGQAVGILQPPGPNGDRRHGTRLGALQKDDPGGDPADHPRLQGQPTLTELFGGFGLGELAPERLVEIGDVAVSRLFLRLLRRPSVSHGPGSVRTGPGGAKRGLRRARCSFARHRFGGPSENTATTKPRSTS